jgi:hypothetical protein
MLRKETTVCNRNSFQSVIDGQVKCYFREESKW